MGRNRLFKVIPPLLVIMLLGATGLASSAPSKHTIRIDQIGVAFDVPRGFVVLQQNNTHHVFHTKISFGREFRPGHLTSAPLRLVFWPGAFDGSQTITQYTPSQYVDAEFNRVTKAIREGPPGFRELKYVKLFGNKAVHYTVEGLDADTVLIGYLRREQLPERLRPFVEEYCVRIDFSWVSPAAEEDLHKNLFNTVLNSLRIIP